MQEKPTNLKRGLTLVTLFTLLTGAMVGMAWAVLANVFLDRGGPARPGVCSKLGRVGRGANK